MQQEAFPLLQYFRSTLRMPASAVRWKKRLARARNTSISAQSKSKYKK